MGLTREFGYNVGLTIFDSTDFELGVWSGYVGIMMTIMMMMMMRKVGLIVGRSIVDDNRLG